MLSGQSFLAASLEKTLGNERSTSCAPSNCSVGDFTQLCYTGSQSTSVTPCQVMSFCADSDCPLPCRIMRCYLLHRLTRFALVRKYDHNVAAEVHSEGRRIEMNRLEHIDACALCFLS
eukprot:6470260-Amphidinium_carterae.2